MAKKKVKTKKKKSIRPKTKSKSTKLSKGNEFIIPKYIDPPESLWRKVLRWFGF